MIHGERESREHEALHSWVFISFWLQRTTTKRAHAHTHTQVHFENFLGLFARLSAKSFQVLCNQTNTVRYWCKQLMFRSLFFLSLIRLNTHQFWHTTSESQLHHRNRQPHCLGKTYATHALNNLCNQTINEFIRSSNFASVSDSDSDSEKYSILVCSIHSIHK